MRLLKTDSKPAPMSLIDHIKWFLFSPSATWLMSLLLLLAECILNVLVIWFVRYTEIDWGAYMSEVEGVVNGTYDYTQLRGATGPLVYPAGFVYVFLGFYYATQLGANIRRAQYMFVGVYALTLGAVHCIYIKTKMPPYLLLFLSCISYRIHSIFVLRLFNDPIAMLLLYISVICLLNNKKTVGCALFSLAFSIKMNIVLFAPGLGLLLLSSVGWFSTMQLVVLCGSIQVGLGLPFLMENPMGYLQRSFDLGRQFEYKWTVNWKCIPEELFLDRRLHLALLACTVAVWFIFILKWSRPFGGLVQLFRKTGGDAPVGSSLSVQSAVMVLFTSNFIGMVFSRSLHYQFYVWYFHTLPFLLWNTKLPEIVRIALLFAIEFSWNVYPATILSSCVLHVSHVIILIALIFTPTLTLVQEKLKAR